MALIAAHLNAGIILAVSLLRREGGGLGVWCMINRPLVVGSMMITRQPPINQQSTR